jgi:hypothetical protein
MVFFISKEPPRESFLWLRVEQRDTASILASLQRDDKIAQRDLAEALETGLSRPPRPKSDGFSLSSYARIVRGIATGANEFFFLTRKWNTGHPHPCFSLISGGATAVSFLIALALYH